MIKKYDFFDFIRRNTLMMNILNCHKIRKKYLNNILLTQKCYITIVSKMIFILNFA